MGTTSSRASMFALLATVSLLASGCASARWVQCGADGGVVAMPSNTTQNREKALALIREKCPDFEIVHEEEVVVGQTAHTNTETDVNGPGSIVVGGGKKGARAGIAVPLGPTQRTTVQTTSYEDITEWRITYRPRHGTAAAPFSAN
jgi:hypothetical protein